MRDDEEQNAAVGEGDIAFSLSVLVMCRV